MSEDEQQISSTPQTADEIRWKAIDEAMSALDRLSEILKGERKFSQMYIANRAWHLVLGIEKDLK